MEDSHFQKRVEDWLKEQGYPLELRTARTIRKRGWSLHHSRRYKDPVLGKEREIDILAFYDDRDENRAFRIHGQLVIECKWTTKKPWVLFTSEGRALTDLGIFVSTPMTDRALGTARGLNDDDISSFPLFANLDESYGIVQAFSKDAAVDAAHSAVHSAISAATSFARDMSASTSHSIIYIPTVVIDGELFRCSLSEEAEVSVQPTDMGSLIYDSTENAMVNATCIHVVRESALEKFIDRAAATFDALRAMVKQRRTETKG